jgi:hypothetical protein
MFNESKIIAKVRMMSDQQVKGAGIYNTNGTVLDSGTA